MQSFTKPPKNFSKKKEKHVKYIKRYLKLYATYINLKKY